MANGDWRSIRHEREQFVHSKLKKKETLLSDDENEKESKNKRSISDDEEEESQSEEELTSSNSLLGSNPWNNQLLKKGQQLLKQSSVFKSFQAKRPIDDDLNVNRITRTGGNSLSKSSITIEPLNKQQDKKSDSGFKVATHDQMSKFSFLNRDKSYLNRLSSYVNKNLNNQSEKFSFKSIKPNNMVFTTIDVEPANNDLNNDENKAFKPLNKVIINRIQFYFKN